MTSELAVHLSSVPQVQFSSCRSDISIDSIAALKSRLGTAYGSLYFVTAHLTVSHKRIPFTHLYPFPTNSNIISSAATP